MAEQKSKVREGFEAQRKVGINVDWFTWQIAWHDALFAIHDIAGDVVPAQSGELVAIDAGVLHRLNDATKPIDAADRNVIVRMLSERTALSAGCADGSKDSSDARDLALREAIAACDKVIVKEGMSSTGLGAYMCRSAISAISKEPK